MFFKIKAHMKDTLQGLFWSRLKSGQVFIRQEAAGVHPMSLSSEPKQHIFNAFISSATRFNIENKTQILIIRKMLNIRAYNWPWE